MYAPIWMLGALISFSFMAVGARELSGELSTFQILFFRSLIGLVIVSAVILGLRDHGLFASSRKGLHGFRNLFHFAGQYGWFLGLGLLPLAEVFALEFTMPIWVVIIASLFLNEALSIKKIVAIVLGMAGVLLIVRPGIEIIDAASFIVLAAALFYAVSHTVTKSLSSTDKPLTIVFYMCLIQLPIAWILALPGWIWPNNIEWLWLTIVGLTALTAHFCMTKAMQHAEVGTVVVLDFFRLPLIAIVGVMVYGETFDIALIAGGALMLLGNMINHYRTPTEVKS